MIPGISGKQEKGIREYHLKERFSVRTDSFESRCLEAFCIRTNSGMDCVQTAADLELIRDCGLAEEEYRIQTSDSGIRIFAANETGVIWALTTIAERMGNQRRIGFGTVEDRPRYGYRGLLLDCTRHFFQAEEVKKIIDEIARVKMNRLHWHLSNDQGFRIESKRFPKLQETSGDEYYTQEEIRDIVEFASIRGVEIIPEIDMPGHTSAILAAYPGYSCSGKKVAPAKTGGIYPIVLCPGNDRTYLFLKELLEEVCGLFPSKWFHIGGDEAPDTEWKNCECCRRKMRENYLSNTRQLQGYFSGRVKAILREFHKNIICWNDSLEADNFAWEEETAVRTTESQTTENQTTKSRDMQSQQTQIQYWSVQYADSMQAYIEKGGRFIYSDMFELYLDYPCAMTSCDKVYRCIPMIRDTDYSGFAQLAGLECCLWTEHVDNVRRLEERLFPRIYAAAENAWNGSEGEADFEQRLKAHIEEAKQRGIYCLSAEESNPSGEARKKEIMEYTAVMQNSMPEDVRKVTIEFTKPNEEFSKRFMEKFFGA